MSAILGFLGRRISIAWWPTFEHVKEVNVFATQLTSSKNLVEKLACGTDKGLATAVFVGTGCLAQKAESSLWIADSENRLRPGTGQFLAQGASCDLVLQKCKCGWGLRVGGWRKGVGGFVTGAVVADGASAGPRARGSGLDLLNASSMQAF